MLYKSEFNKEDTEYIFQQIEEIKKYSSPDAQFLIEEEDVILSDDEDDDLEPMSHRIILKMKQNDVVYSVDSSSISLFGAVKLAKEEMINILIDIKGKSPAVSIPMLLH